MKKGFTMIELIFVIVILGILASVAIPRLAATREDAEISAAVANLRTLVSDASAYYTAKGTFGTDTKWKDITNAPLTKNGGVPITTELATQAGYLYIGNTRCIDVTLQDKLGTLPAYIKFTPNNNNTSNVCKQVLAAAPIKAYLDSKVSDTLPGTMAIGSSTRVYSK